MSSDFKRDTVAAIATPPGKGGVGIVRISGNSALSVGRSITGFNSEEPVKNRHAYYRDFLSIEGEVLDQGIFIFFQSPHSFTGEDVVEIQAHGGPLVLDMILKSAVFLGARLANPGEFSERAFLNGKVDLVQAEAIADLINASSRYAARCAMRSLSGGFSKEINELLAYLIRIRTIVEAMLDFPDEEVTPASRQQIGDDLNMLYRQCQTCLGKAKQGSTINNGIRLLILGEPNVGKSSLLNLLSDNNRAIVTDIPGTTRDIIAEHIHIDGIPIHLIDTAGLRKTSDKVEQEGIYRAKQEVQSADHIFLLVDAQNFSESNLESLAAGWVKHLELDTLDWQWEKVTLIVNKIDLVPTFQEEGFECQGIEGIYMSVQQGKGLNLLKQRIKSFSGLQETEAPFIARRRHVESLNKTIQDLQAALTTLEETALLELVAEELNSAQRNLSEITGRYTADDLLGNIFSSFCIGK